MTNFKIHIDCSDAITLVTEVHFKSNGYLISYETNNSKNSNLNIKLCKQKIFCSKGPTISNGCNELPVFLTDFAMRNILLRNWQPFSY